MLCPSEQPIGCHCSIDKAMQIAVGRESAYHHRLRVDAVMQIMELLGPSLWDVWKQTDQSLATEYVACVAVEALTILEDLHSRGCDTHPVCKCIATLARRVMLACHEGQAYQQEPRPDGKMHGCPAAGLCMGTSSLRTLFWAIQTHLSVSACTLWIWA